MAVALNPYLSFLNTARGAMEFYRTVFGGDLQVMTFGDMPGMPVDESERDMVMHAQLTGDNGIVLMGADTPHSMNFSPPAGMTVSLSGDDEATLQGYWDKLSDGATIGEPLKKAPWGDSFGMLTDKFGTPWLVNISGSGG
jgi:PhnB protein